MVMIMAGTSFDDISTTFVLCKLFLFAFYNEIS